MESTRKLASVLVCIITLFLVYITYVNYEKISTYVVRTVKKYTKDAVVVPSISYNHRMYSYLTVKETDNFEPKNIEDLKSIYFTVLNNGWDEFTFYCPMEYETCYEDIKTIANGEDENYITLINNYVSPFNSYKKYNTSIQDDTIILRVDKIYTDEEIYTVNTKIDNYISKNNFNKSNITKKDIEKIHDYILSITTYDTNYKFTDQIVDSNKATGVLVNGVSLCSGYADTFAVILDKLGVPNFRVSSEEHEWNAIYFNNRWYHIDLTWDDDEVIKTNNRNFFMINTTELLNKDKKEHNFNKDQYLEFK